MKKKKLLFVINTLGHAGAEMALLELLRKMPKEYEISLLVLMSQGELRQELPPSVKLLNQEYCDLSVLTKEGRKYMTGTVLKAFFKKGAGFRRSGYLLGRLWTMIKKHKIMVDKLLWRIIADSAPGLTEEYDLAVAYLEGASAYYVADYVRAKKKAAFVHIDYAQAGYDRKMDGDCYLAYDRIFGVSAEVKEHFLQVYPECQDKTFVFHNIIDGARILERSKEPGGFTDNYTGKRLLTVGRLHYQKGYDITIEAMKLLKEQREKVRWYVLGEGKERARLERKIRELSLEEDFILLGANKNPYPYLAQTNLYVHAVRYEGKSIALQEAQVLGCAILASDCSGNREQMIDGVDGKMCPLDAECIKNSILELLSNPKLCAQMGAAAKEKNITYEGELETLLELL